MNIQIEKGITISNRTALEIKRIQRKRNKSYERYEKEW